MMCFSPFSTGTVEGTVTRVINFSSLSTVQVKIDTKFARTIYTVLYCTYSTHVKKGWPARNIQLYFLARHNFLFYVYVE